MIKQFLLRWLGNGVGLWIAAQLIPGIGYGEKIRVIFVAALVFSIVNAVVRPIIVLLSLPAIVYTLGFFTLVINALMLFLVSIIYPRFQLDTFGAALLAVIIVWLVNYAVSVFVSSPQEVSER